MTEDGASANPKTLPNLLLQEMQNRLEDRNRPPIEDWSPKWCGNIDMEIRSDGSWWYMKTPIDRQSLVQLFASVLTLDPEYGYVLITPVEKVGIKVADAPFLAVDMACEGKGENRRIGLCLNTDDWLFLDRDHSLFFRKRFGAHRPYVRVRGKLDALISRPIYYRMVDMALEDQQDPQQLPGLWSCGVCFSLSPEPTGAYSS